MSLPVPGFVKRVAKAYIRRSYARSAPGVLTAEQRRFWDDNGYLVLPRHFTADAVRAMNALVDDIWASSRHTPRQTVVDIFIGTPREARTRIQDAPLEARKFPYKMNDLFLESDEVRGMVLEPRLTDALTDLLEGAPLVCNSLNFEYGSQQKDHVDSIYMGAPVKQYLAATWIALEDGSMDSGPLRYYAGSHKIPAYRFSNGGTAAVDAEMPQFRDYMTRELEQRGIKGEIFVPKSGDVFIWHSQLFHGGVPIKDPSLTRKSLVTHYWRAQDVPGIHGHIGSLTSGRHYLKRNPQPVDAPIDDH
jgi:ectoine hydroxylase-related dioxygenase (phytanoyl-CoA dioxygenase family)